MVLAGWGTAPSYAQSDAGLVLTWTAPDVCPSQAAVEAEIARLLGGPPASSANRLFRVRAAVTRGALWQVVLDTSSEEGSGHRTLEATTCDGLANATALIVALMIDPAATLVRESMALDKPDSRPLPPTAPARPTPPPAPAARGPANTLFTNTLSTNTLFVGAVASGSLGVLPAPDLAAAGAVGLAGSNWRVELRGAYGLRHVESDVLAATSGGHGEFQARFLGTLTGCLTRSPSGIEWGFCLDVEGGVIQGRGKGTSTTEDKLQPWLGVGAGGLFALRAGKHLAFPVHVDAIVPVWRPTYVFTNVPSPIFRAWPVGGRLTASVEWRF
jgi:hypothetical protein